MHLREGGEGASDSSDIHKEMFATPFIYTRLVFIETKWVGNLKSVCCNGTSISICR